jgi:hypothetical protein
MAFRRKIVKHIAYVLKYPSMRRIRLWSVAGLMLMLALGVAFIPIKQNKQAVKLTLGKLLFSPYSDPASEAAIPASIQQLDGQTVEIVGDCWDPWSDGDQIVAFQLTDMANYNELRPPVAQEFINVKMKSGGAILSPNRRMIVHGTLRVKIERDQDGAIKSIYRIDADWAKPFPLPLQNPNELGLLGWVILAEASAVVLVLLIFSMARLVGGRRKSFKWPYCPHCGYDLRGCSDRCPECGAVVVRIIPWKERHATMGGTPMLPHATN